VDDPDFSNFGPGQGGGGGDGPGGGGGGLFGGQFDPDDPEVQAALEACQDIFGGGFGPRGGGGGGNG
ncbi:MAG: hypothetical protein IIA44_05580, partial [Acidobacteria bacterium]|nr:hypothetical protein [Acidobacteriota bacterium]